MTFGKPRAPAALEKDQCIRYRDELSNLILDHCIKIDTVYAILNGLICHRNPQRDHSFQILHTGLVLKQHTYTRLFSSYTLCDQTKCGANVAIQVKSNLTFVFLRL